MIFDSEENYLFIKKFLFISNIACYYNAAKKTYHNEIFNKNAIALTCSENKAIFPSDKKFNKTRVESSRLGSS